MSGSLGLNRLEDGVSSKSTSDPSSNCFGLYSKCNHCIAHQHHSERRLNLLIATRVSHLLCLCCPAAVAFRITQVVFDSIKRMFFAWSGAHVFYEIAKRMPFVAHRNPTASVVLVCRVLRVDAPLKHRGPHVVLTRLTLSVSLGRFRGRFALQASARLGSRGQLKSSNRFRISAFA